MACGRHLAAPFVQSTRSAICFKSIYVNQFATQRDSSRDRNSGTAKSTVNTALLPAHSSKAGAAERGSSVMRAATENGCREGSCSSELHSRRRCRRAGRTARNIADVEGPRPTLLKGDVGLDVKGRRPSLAGPPKGPAWRGRSPRRWSGRVSRRLARRAREHERVRAASL